MSMLPLQPEHACAMRRQAVRILATMLKARDDQDLGPWNTLPTAIALTAENSTCPAEYVRLLHRHLDDLRMHRVTETAIIPVCVRFLDADATASQIKDVLLDSLRRSRALKGYAVGDTVRVDSSGQYHGRTGHVYMTTTNKKDGKQISCRIDFGNGDITKGYIQTSNIHLVSEDPPLPFRATIRGSSANATVTVVERADATRVRVQRANGEDELVQASTLDPVRPCVLHMFLLDTTRGVFWTDRIKKVRAAVELVNDLLLNAEREAEVGSHEDPRPRLILEMFLVDELQFNLLDHRMQPSFKLLSRDDWAEFNLTSGTEDMMDSGRRDMGGVVEIDACDVAMPAAATTSASRITTPYMTKLECARVLGARALQISMNAPVMIDVNGETDPMEIARKELCARTLPFTIRRHLPAGGHEDWTVAELIAPDAKDMPRPSEGCTALPLLLASCEKHFVPTDPVVRYFGLGRTVVTLGKEAARMRLPCSDTAFRITHAHSNAGVTVDLRMLSASSFKSGSAARTRTPYQGEEDGEEGEGNDTDAGGAQTASDWLLDTHANANDRAFTQVRKELLTKAGFR